MSNEIERLFLAVVPPTEVVDTISNLPTEPRRGVRYTRRAQWHITIRYLGDSVLNDALQALASFTAPATTVTLGPEVSLLGSRVVMVPAAGLDELAATAAIAFADVGEPQERPPFTGHLTLARLKGAPLRDPSIVEVLGAPIHAQFPAGAISLIKTEPTSDGVLYTPLAQQELTS